MAAAMPGLKSSELVLIVPRQSAIKSKWRVSKPSRADLNNVLDPESDSARHGTRGLQ